MGAGWRVSGGGRESKSLMRLRVRHCRTVAKKIPEASWENPLVPNAMLRQIYQKLVRSTAG